VAKRPFQDNKHLDNIAPSDSHTQNSNLYVSQPSTSGLNTRHSSSERSLHRVIRVIIRPFPKARSTKREKQARNATLEAEVKARANPVKFNRLFSDSYKKSRKPK
jgi:hypothetical protein